MAAAAAAETVTVTAATAAETVTATAATAAETVTATAAAAATAAEIATSTARAANRRCFHADASIVLIGSRGAGKRSLGFIGALHLRRRLVTEDHYFEQATGTTRGQYVQLYGQEAFAQRNAEVFRQMLAANSQRCVIECGMSSLTADAQNALTEYCARHPVIYIHREPERVLPYLDSAVADQLLQADLSHRQCSNFEFYNLYDESSCATGGANGDAAHGLRTGDSGGSSGSSPQAPDSSPRLFQAKEDFSRYLDLLLGQTWRRQLSESPFSLNAVPPELRAYSYALRLRLSYLVDMDVAWDDLEAQGDCVEFIIDHWPADLFTVIARQVALIRRRLAVPIIYHVEEHPREERSRSLEERDRMDAELLQLGLRLNVEYISLDLQRSPALVAGVLAERGRARVLGNFWHAGLSAPPWTDAVHLRNYRRAQALGCDVVRMARFSVGQETVRQLAQLRAAVEQPQPAAAGLASGGRPKPQPQPPLVAFDYSILGVYSPLQSRVLNPVKHPQARIGREHLAVVSVSDVAFGNLFGSGELDALRFYTIGSHIAYSITPAIHRAAFAFAHMPHTFQAQPCSTLDDLDDLFLRPDRGVHNRTFGGATLAAPFKVAILPRLKLQSQHATALGAVNVILPLRGGPHRSVLDHVNARNKAGPCGDFYGDNTDWRSIFQCLQRAISPRNFVQPSRTTALVVGAGGMARAAIYALMQLGCRHIFLYNRTPERARQVAAHFNALAQSQRLSARHAAAAAGQDSTEADVLCHVLDGKLAQPWPAPYQMPTMVISCVPATNTDGSVAADFQMPPQWLGSPTGGVVVELAYEPVVTPLVRQMRAFQHTGSPPWTVVDGLEVVTEMAIEAFELMTGRMAPRKLMRTTCYQAWEKQQQERRRSGPQ